MTQGDWQSKVLDWFETGSRVVCDPPVEGTDYDVVGLVDKSTDVEEVVRLGFDYGGSFSNDAEYHSLRSGEFNLILTSSRRDFEMFKLATKVAKLLNVKDKAKRVALFEAIRHGEFRYDAG